MTTISTDQSDSAAERSAHVSRGKQLETLSDLKPAVVKLADGSWKIRVLHEAEQRIVKLERLVQILIDEDPNDMAADAVTVLDVWRKEAIEVMEGKKDGNDQG